MSERFEMGRARAREGGGGESGMRADLEAYYDGELSWWRRRRMAARLGRSEELRRELDLLQQIGSAAVAAEAAPAPHDVWREISGQLGAIDAERRQGAAQSRDLAALVKGLLGLSSWKPIGWVAAAGAAALAVGLWNPSGPLLDEPAGGALRYLDTLGASVMVIDEEDVTIIWLMEG